MARSAGGVRVLGLNALVRDLKAVGLDVDDLKDAFSTIAAEGARRVAAHAPRLTGRLAGDVRGNRAQSKAVVTVGRAAIAYAGPINYGWPRRGIEADGFLQEGDAEMQPIAVRQLTTEIDQAIRRRGLA